MLEAQLFRKMGRPKPGLEPADIAQRYVEKYGQNLSRYQTRPTRPTLPTLYHFWKQLTALECFM